MRIGYTVVTNELPWFQWRGALEELISRLNGMSRTDVGIRAHRIAQSSAPCSPSAGKTDVTHHLKHPLKGPTPLTVHWPEPDRCSPQPQRDWETWRSTWIFAEQKMFLTQLVCLLWAWRQIDLDVNQGAREMGCLPLHLAVALRARVGIIGNSSGGYVPRPFHEPPNQGMGRRTLARFCSSWSWQALEERKENDPSVTHWTWAKSLSGRLHLCSCRANQREDLNFSGTFSSQLDCSSWATVWWGWALCLGRSH